MSKIVSAYVDKKNGVPPIVVFVLQKAGLFHEIQMIPTVDRENSSLYIVTKY